MLSESIVRRSAWRTGINEFYRHVRNPMYVAVASVILSQGLLLGSRAIGVYGLVVWACCHVFVVSSEEPTRERTFGPEYDTFRANVPRWLPRLRPWRAAH